MKTHRILGFALVVIIICLSACSGGDEPIVPTSEIIIDDNIVANGLSFTREKGEQSVSFSTNESWTLKITGITGGPAWCSASATSGTKGAASVKFCVTENTSYENRIVSVSIKSGTASKYFSISQQCADGLLVTTDKYEIGPEGGVVEVKVNTNVEFEVQIPSDVTWITQTDSRSLKEKTIYLKVEEYTSTDDRSAEIALVDKEAQISECIIVNQVGVATGSYENGVVTFDKAGNLKKFLGDDYLNITSLKVVGPLNGDDVRCLRQMLGGKEFGSAEKGMLASLDLKDASIVEGGGAYYESHTTSGDVIGKNMFYWCTNLQDMVLPAGVVSIGDSAFMYCSSLVSIDIPDGVTSFGASAFHSCSSLLSIDVPASVTFIGMSAFKDCYTLDSVYITDMSAWCRITFEDISSNPFLNLCSFYLNNQEVKELVIPEDVTEIKPYAFTRCIFLTSVSMGDGVTTIGASAFSSTNLTAIRIGDGVTSIGANAFDSCISLTSVTMGASVTTMGTGAFSQCYHLKSVHITDLSAWCKITFEGNKSNPLYNEARLYLNNQEVRELVIPRDVTEIKHDAFSKCSSLTSVYIPDNVTSISENAFYRCPTLVSVTMGDGVASVGKAAFYACPSLASVAMGDGVSSIGWGAFDSCSALVSVTMGKGVTTIGEFAFSGCYSLPSIDIPDGITSIGEYAFGACRSLVSIDISGSDASIGNNAFSCCSSLESVTMGAGVVSIGSSAFNNCSALASVNIGDDVTTIGNFAFYGCSSLASFTMGAGVASIGKNAFSNCTSLESVHITDLSAWCKITFENTNSNPIALNAKLYLNNQELTKLVIPEDVTEIKTYAFYGCSSLTSVDIHAGVTYIGWYAFYGCSSLPSIAIPASVTFIGNNAFVGCTSLESVHITDLSAWCKITFGNAFSNPLHGVDKLYLNNKELTKLVIPADIKDIKNYAFYGCRSIKEVTFGAGVTSINIQSFGECPSLTKAYCQGTNPPYINTSPSAPSFEGSKDDKTLFVPKGYIKEYEDSGWTSFFGTIKEM